MSEQVSRSIAHPKTERQLNAKLLPVLVALFAGLYTLTGYRGWLAFFICSAGAWLLAWLWIRSIERRLHLDRSINQAWAHAGEAVPEQILITNNSRFPVLWLEICDESEVPTESVRIVTEVDARMTHRRTFMHQFKKRGLYTLGPTRLRTGDPLGIYTLTLHNPQSNTILITPPQIPLKSLKIPPGGVADGKLHQMVVFARQNSDTGVREYLPGDEFKRIHWRSSAHQDALMVRLLESAVSEDWWIIPDLDASVQAGSGMDSTLELSIMTAASLVSRGLKEHHKVGLGLAGPRLLWIEPRSGLAQRWKLIRTLAAAEPGDRSLGDILRGFHPDRFGSLIIITSSNNPGSLVQAYQSMRSRKLAILLINPVEFDPSFAHDRLPLQLAKWGIPYSQVPRSLLDEAYAKARFKHSEHIKRPDAPQRFMEQGRSNWQTMD